MTSPLNSRERVDLARSFATTVFPVGRPVVVGIPYADRKKPAVTIRYYPSAQCVLPAPRRGRRWLPSHGVGHLFAGLTLRQLWAGMMRCFPDSALPARFSGARGTFAGFSNLFGPFQAARRSFRALLKFCQEPSCRFSKSFEVLSAVFAHGEHNGRRMRQSAVKE